jgi:hypothetical protein
MIAVYYNYPNSGFTIHEGMNYEEARVQLKPKPRVDSVTLENITEIVEKVKSQDLKFASNRDLNDLWLEIDFGDVVFEKAFAEFVLRILGKRYKRFRDIWN